MEVNRISDGACGAFNPGAHICLGWAEGGLGVGECIPSALIPDFSSRPCQIYCGDALETIRQLKAGGTKFDCVCTSPPFHRQRRYGDSSREIGQEKSVDSFMSTLVGIFEEIPLRPWASVWVNIGDKRGSKKELQGVPERFVIAMQDAGFFLVDRVEWAKEVVMVDGTFIGHCQVEPAPGRLNGNGWEAFYHFVVDPRKAWSDVCAVRIPRDRDRCFYENTVTPVEQHPYSKTMKCVTSLEGRIPPTVWYIGNSRKGRGHFAAFPKELVERPIAMTCPEYLVDDEGKTKPRERIVEKIVYSEWPRKFKRVYGQYSRWQEQHQSESAPTKEEREMLDALREKSGRMDSGRPYIAHYPETLGWTHEDRPVIGAGIVLDPFGGSGTTGEVAILLGRRFVGIELYQPHADRMAERCEEAFGRLNQAGKDAPVGTPLS